MQRCSVIFNRIKVCCISFCYVVSLYRVMIYLLWILAEKTLCLLAGNKHGWMARSVDLVLTYIQSDYQMRLVCRES